MIVDSNDVFNNNLLLNTKRVWKLTINERKEKNSANINLVKWS